MSEEGKVIEVELEEGKQFSDVMKSKRFISFMVYLIATYLLFPLGTHFFPEVFATINPNLFMEHATNVILVLIGGYSAQDAMNALRKK